MTTVLLSVVFLAVVILAMSVGVLMGRKPIKGSCGGMSAIGMKTSCDICGGDTEACERESARGEDKDQLGYDATGKDG